MEMIDRLLGHRVYLDTNVFIYALEGFPRFTVGAHFRRGDSCDYWHPNAGRYSCGYGRRKELRFFCKGRQINQGRWFDRDRRFRTATCGGIMKVWAA
ncbi:MAG: hypothetical protein ACT4N2_03810 [Hyphomicrobium sp.]